ncbi:MAG: alpha/beta hydrolase [Pseudomonadota bacterium]
MTADRHRPASRGGDGRGGRPLGRRTLLTAALGAAIAAGAASAAQARRPDAEAEAAAARAAEERFPPLGRRVEIDLDEAVHVWDRGPADASGPGRAPAVLIHGASGNLRDFAFNIGPRVARDRRALAMDRPGFGYSDRRGPEPWSPVSQARRLRAAARALGVSRPILVGHSFGAAVALAWALEHPEDVSGVVAVSGVTMPYGGVSRVARALRLDRLAVNLYASRLRDTAETGGIERFIARVFRPQSPPPNYANFVGGQLALRPATLQANKEDILNLNGALRDMRPRYGALKTPLEILHGDADFIDADRQSRKLAEAVPGARYTELPGVGHMAHHAATDALLEALARLDARA